MTAAEPRVAGDVSADRPAHEARRHSLEDVDQEHHGAPLLAQLLGCVQRPRVSRADAADVDLTLGRDAGHDDCGRNGPEYVRDNQRNGYVHGRTVPCGSTDGSARSLPGLGDRYGPRIVGRCPSEFGPVISPRQRPGESRGCGTGSGLWRAGMGVISPKSRTDGRLWTATGGRVRSQIRWSTR